MNTMHNSNFNTFLDEHLDNKDRYTSTNKMKVLRLMQTDILAVEDSGIRKDFLHTMTDKPYVRNQWHNDHKIWFKKRGIILDEDLVEDITLLAGHLYDIFTMKYLYEKLPENSTIYWQLIMNGVEIGSSYYALFQMISSIPDGEYPVSFLTGSIAIALDLHMEGHYIALRNDEPTTELWRLAETMYGSKAALKYKGL